MDTFQRFSTIQRKALVAQMAGIHFDIVVFGGGITGAGIALDAADRGLLVALFENNDFASGTSSRSTKLVHGGLRYLEKLQFRFVAQDICIPFGMELGAGKRGHDGEGGVFVLEPPHIGEQIAEVLPAVIRIDHVGGVHHDPKLVEDFDRPALLGRGYPFVHGQKPRVGKVFHPHEYLGQADFCPLGEQFRVVDDGVHPAVEKVVLLDSRLLDQIG